MACNAGKIFDCLSGIRNEEDIIGITNDSSVDDLASDNVVNGR